MGDAAEQYDLPVPSILKPVELWTGKQVFSAMVQPNTGTRYVSTLALLLKSPGLPYSVPRLTCGTVRLPVPLEVTQSLTQCLSAPSCCNLHS